MSIEILNFFGNNEFKNLDSTEKIIYLLIYEYDQNDLLLSISKLTSLIGMRRCSVDNAVERLLNKDIIIKKKHTSTEIDRKMFYVYLNKKLDRKNERK